MFNQSSDGPIRAFYCLIEGDNRLFKVEIAANKMIYDLMEEIHKRGIGDSERPILAKDLTLLKVTTTQILVQTFTFLCFCRSI